MRRFSFLFFLIILILFSCSNDDRESISFNLKPWYEYRTIAHGLGHIDSIAATNTYEAFLNSYNNGFRLFELDLNYTSDSVLVLCHSWTNYKAAMNIDTVPSYYFFMNHLLYGKYRPLQMKDIISIMNQYSDTYFIIDGWHAGNPAKYTKDLLVLSGGNSSLLNRMIPEVPTDETFEIIESIHHFKGYVYSGVGGGRSTLKDNAVFCQVHGIGAVSIPENNLKDIDLQTYSDYAVKIYTYTSNNVEIVDSIVKKGVWGIYTDYITPQFLDTLKLK